jgi:hypothetical protein
VAIAKHLMELFVMTASSGDQFIARNSPNNSPARARPDVVAAKDHLLLHTRVTYAPLTIWKDFHWTCTVTSFAPPVQDRLE